MIKQLIKYCTASILLFALGCEYNTDNSTANLKASFQESAALCRYVDLQQLQQVVMLSVPYIKQEPNYCGPASAAMILNYMGSNVTQDQIGSGLVDSTGTNPTELKDRVESFGYYLSVVSCGFNNLLSLLDDGRPVIVRILNNTKDNGHYIVVKGYDMNKMLVYVNDPQNQSRGSINFSDFRALWDINSLGQEQNSYNLMLIISK